MSGFSGLVYRSSGAAGPDEDIVIEGRRQTSLTISNNCLAVCSAFGGPVISNGFQYNYEHFSQFGLPTLAAELQALSLLTPGSKAKAAGGAVKAGGAKALAGAKASGTKAMAAAGKALGPSGSVFGRQRLGGSSIGNINANDYLRIGWGWKGSYSTGTHVFRISGQWLDNVTGVARSHIDLFTAP